VTTRGRNLRRLHSLHRGLGPAAARLLSRGVPRLDGGILTAPGLPSRSLPPANLALADGVLAVPLIPLPGAIPDSTPFAQAHPPPGTSYSGREAAGWLIVVGAHGSVPLPREARGECCYILPGRCRSRREPAGQSMRGSARRTRRLGNKTTKETVSESPLRKKRGEENGRNKTVGE
jgi:hypothetical protein